MTDTTTAEVRRAERALYDAMIARDFAALDRMLDPDLVYVHSTAVSEGKTQYLAGVAAGQYEYESIGPVDGRVRVAGDIALVDGIGTMRVGMTGAAKELLHLRVVLVWRRSGHDWRLLHRHGIRMKAP
jgi:ketosteroid isomerase-like protein